MSLEGFVREFVLKEKIGEDTLTSLDKPVQVNHICRLG